MSTTYWLECDTCKESICVGQYNYIYKSPTYIKGLERFLFKHSGLNEIGTEWGHPLFFRQEQQCKLWDNDDWSEFRPFEKDVI